MCQQILASQMRLCLFKRVSLCLQPSFVVTPVLQSVVSERDEVSSISQKCPTAAPRLSCWLAVLPDSVKVMAPGVERSLAVSVGHVYKDDKQAKLIVSV